MSEETNTRDTPSPSVDQQSEVPIEGKEASTNKTFSFTSFNMKMEIEEAKIPSTTENDKTPPNIVMPLDFHEKENDHYNIHPNLIKSLLITTKELVNFSEVYAYCHRQHTDKKVLSDIESQVNEKSSFENLVQKLVSWIHSLDRKQKIVIYLGAYNPLLHHCIDASNRVKENLTILSKEPETWNDDETTCFITDIRTLSTTCPKLVLASDLDLGFGLQHIMQFQIDESIDMAIQASDITIDDVNISQQQLTTMLTKYMSDLSNAKDCLYNQRVYQETSLDEILRTYLIELATMIGGGIITYTLSKDVTIIYSQASYHQQFVSLLKEKSVEGGFLSKYIFKRAFNEKKVAQSKGIPVPFWDFLLMDKLKREINLPNIRAFYVSLASPTDFLIDQEFLQVLTDSQILSFYGTRAHFGIQFRSVWSDWRLKKFPSMVSICGPFLLRDRPEQHVSVEKDQMGECIYQDGTSSGLIIRFDERHACQMMDITQTPSTPESKLEALLKAQFRRIDKDHNGSLDESELKQLLIQVLGEQFPNLDDACNDILNQVDKDGDHLISFEEFKSLSPFIINLKLSSSL